MAKLIHESRPGINYRPEVDGLRALAVLPVIFFHAGIDFFSGGYVGVDVFFVISGFLITLILLQDAESSGFSFLGFYERRARRILPALFAVMMVCVPFAWLIMLPSQMKDFSQSFVAIIFFSSNFLFWMESDYFDSLSEEKPLLHTWSLAVEEQYYIVFPLFLLLIVKKYRGDYFWLMAFFAFISFLYCEFMWQHDSMANFYLLPSRAWELLVGALGAVLVFRNGQSNSNTLSGIGLLMILSSVVLFDKNTPFPSLYTALPVFGALLVLLYGGKGTIAAKLLGLRLMVGIGLVSYSAYLWHNPIFSFARLYFSTELSDLLMACLGFFSVLIGFLSWKYIESPFRDSNVVSSRVMWFFSGATAIVFLFFGVAGHLSEGFSSRYSGNEMYISSSEKVKVNFGLSEQCEGGLKIIDDCMTSDSPEILVWGDSFAMHVVPALIASNPNVSLLQATVSQCAPVLGLSVVGSFHGEENCIDFNDQVFDYLSRSETINFVVFSSPFSRLQDNKPVIDREGVVHSNSRHMVSEGIAHLVKKIRSLGKVPVVVTPPPVDGSNLGLCLLNNSLRHNELRRCDFEKGKIVSRVKLVSNFLNSVEGLNVIDLRSKICQDSKCYASKEGVFLFRDSAHLSYEGGRYLGKSMGLYEIVTSFK